jgi:hypothetical protein
VTARKQAFGTTRATPTVDDEVCADPRASLTSLDTVAATRPACPPRLFDGDVTDAGDVVYGPRNEVERRCGATPRVHDRLSITEGAPLRLLSHSRHHNY